MLAYLKEINENEPLIEEFVSVKIIKNFLNIDLDFVCPRHTYKKAIFQIHDFTPCL